MPGQQRTITVGLACALVLGAGLAAPALAQNSTAPRTRAVATDPDPRVQTLRAMQQRITLTLEDARLEDVLMFIEQSGNLSLDVAWLDDRNPIGLERDAVISLRAKNATLQQVLETALDKAGDEFNQATWQLTDDGTIEVGAKERLNAKKTVKVYDINDLLFVIPNYTDVPELDLDSVLQQSSGRGGGGGGRGVFRVENEDQEEPDEAARAAEILDIITTTVEPEQWQINGGTGASVRFYRGALLISAPDYIHRQLGGYTFVR